MAELNHIHSDRFTKTFNIENDFQNTSTAYLIVNGMSCPNCAVQVYNALVKLEGVFRVGVAWEEAAAAVVYDPLKVNWGEMIDSVADTKKDGCYQYCAKLLAVIRSSEVCGE